MSEKKYQVFISSTFKDLVDERQDIIRSVLDLGHIPSGMEAFPASSTEQLKYISRIIDECDYYVLVIGGRYGSVDQSGVSYTEREFDYAVASGKVVLVFPHADLSKIELGKSETDLKLVQSLNTFREKAMSGRLVKSWKTRQELNGAVVVALSKAMADEPRTGWVRGDVATKPESIEELAAAYKTMEALRQELADQAAHVWQPPSNLAGLDSLFTIYFTGIQQRERTTGSHNFTWGTILRAIGPTFQKPSAPLNIEVRLQSWVESVTSFKAVLIKRQVGETIQLHLEALGLLRTQNFDQVGGGVGEFLSLTPLGRELVVSMGSVKV